MKGRGRFATFLGAVNCVMVLALIFSGVTLGTSPATAQVVCGRFLATWGTTGAGSGEFYSPIGIGIDAASNVYVADAGNNRIQKFDSSGGFITSWGSFGTGDGQFRFPLGVAVDGRDNVYVTDADSFRGQKFEGMSG